MSAAHRSFSLATPSKLKLSLMFSPSTPSTLDRVHPCSSNRGEGTIRSGPGCDWWSPLDSQKSPRWALKKRVNVIADFIDPPDGLGDGYRVETRIVTWEGPEVLKIPGSATFRESDGWSLFLVENGRARRRSIKIGHRNQSEVEVLGGLGVGDVVILHPPNQLRDGVSIRTK